MPRLHSVLEGSFGACALFLVVVLSSCGGSKHSLTDRQLQKLDPPLRSLVRGEDPNRAMSSAERSDGTVAYSVFIRTSNAKRVREAGIPINSESGNILTARLSAGEIRQAARLDAVTSIESSGEATQQAN